MLSEEEKKSIEELKSLSPSESAIKTVLNLITKLQRENEEKDNQIDLMGLAILNYDDQLVINRYKNIDEVKETFKDLAKEKGE